jgi:hypothetical protein
VATILRRQSQPLLGLGDLLFDCEVSVSRGGQREISRRRLASGARVSDHSRRLPRVFQVEGAVSALPPVQNVGRPGFQGGFNATALPAAASAFSPVAIASRIGDFETRLDRLLDDDTYGELELVSKVVGRVRVVLTEWAAVTTGDDGMRAVYRLTLEEVQRAGLTIADATEEALTLTGTGGAPQPGGGGPSQATPVVLDVVP